MTAKYNRSSFLIFLLFFFGTNFVLPEKTFAETINWHQAFDSEYVSQDIKVAPANSNVVYATTRTSTGSGLLMSTDSGQSFLIVFAISLNRDVNSVAISYSNSDKFCIGTYEQGVFCTNSGPVNLSNAGWVGSSLASKKVRFITVDPNNDDIYYAGTGENNGDGGIYKTYNGGQSWIKVGDSSYGSRNCLNIIVDNSNSQRILAGSDFNLFISEDAGINWLPLSIGSTNSPATIFDKTNHAVFYSATGTSGVLKTINNGLDWQSYNTGIQNAMIFRLIEGPDNELFGARRNFPGGLWRTDISGLGSWENVSDPSWGDRNTWGLDVGGGRIFVAVEGLGIYYADLDRVSPPGLAQNPVVIIPGFGGSWSYRGLVENQTTANDDWQMLPFFADNIYGPLISSFEATGFQKNADLFIFAYDFRKSITDSAQALKLFLSQQVLSKNPGKEVNIIAHSMGGLVARQCVERVAGCSDIINKIITAGSPHQGTLKAYKLWEGGIVDDDNAISRTIEEEAIDSLYPLYLTRKDVIQNRFPGVKDLLPVFDYLSGKPYSSMSPQARNQNLANLTPLSSGFTSKTLASSGNSQLTDSQYQTIEPNWWEKSLGLWTDGKPISQTTSIGDETVLQKSSEVLAATNKYYTIKHTDYFRNQSSINDVFEYLQLPKPEPVAAQPLITSLLTFIIHSPATISVTDDNGNIVGQQDSEKAVFIPDPRNGNYNVTITGTETGNYVLETLKSLSGVVSRNTFVGATSTEKKETIKFVNSPGEASSVNEVSIKDLYRSLFLRLAKVDRGERLAWRVKIGTEGFWWWEGVGRDGETERERFDDHSDNFRFGFLLSVYRDLGKILAKELNAEKRENLKEAEKDLAQIIVKNNPKLRISKSKIQLRISQLKRLLNKDKKNPSILDSVNHITAEEHLNDAQENLNSDNDKMAYVLCFAVAVLL
jgi:pimeloyl-ACP methyl ester carboxylesterase